MPDLARARQIRNLLADGTPPPGWPTVTALGEPTAGNPVPKCTILDCPEPGIYRVRTVALTVEFCLSSTYACADHLDHAGRGAIDWVRQP